jgi:hypothetical protein
MPHPEQFTGAIVNFCNIAVFRTALHAPYSTAEDPGVKPAYRHILA